MWKFQMHHVLLAKEFCVIDGTDALREDMTPVQLAEKNVEGTVNNCHGS